MADFRVAAMDEYLAQLAAKRRILEQKSEIRRITAAEFQALRFDTVKKTTEKTAQRNRLAHERNVKLLEDMSIAAHSSSTGAMLQSSRLLNSVSRLDSAREAYVRSASEMLPAWNSLRSDEQLQAAAKLREDRLAIEKRRQRNIEYAEEEIRNTIILEEERRQYLLAVALENRDNAYLQSQSKSLLTESRAVDYLIQKEVDKNNHHAHQRDDRFLNEMKQRVAASLDTHGSGVVETNEEGSANDAYKALSSHLKAMTSPESLTMMLRESPYPPPVSFDSSDFDFQKKKMIGAQPRRDELHNVGHMSERQSSVDGSINLIPTSSHQSLGDDVKLDKLSDHDVCDTVLQNDVIVQKSFDINEDVEIQRTSELHPRTDKLSVETKLISKVGDRICSPRANSNLLRSNSNLSPLSSPSIASKHASKVSNSSHNLTSERNGIKSEQISSPNSRLNDESKENNSTLSNIFSVSEKMELMDRLCRRVEGLDDVSRERDLEESDIHRIRRDEQYLTAIQAYRKAVHSIIGYYSCEDVPASRKTIETKKLSSYLHDLCRAVLDGREREAALYGIESVAEAVIYLTIDVGSYVLPKDLLNGVITEEKVHRNMRSLGGGRIELWSSLTNHLKGIVGSMGASPEELSKIFTAALVLHVPPGDEQHRAERKIRTLLQLEIMPQSLPASPDKSVHSVSSKKANPSTSRDIDIGDSPAESILKSEPARPIGSPRLVEPTIGPDSNKSPPAHSPPKGLNSHVKVLLSPHTDNISSVNSRDAHTGPVYPDSNFSQITDSKKADNAKNDSEKVSESNTSISSVNQSLTSAIPQSSRFTVSQSRNVPSSKKWSSAKNIISVEDDELVSDDEAIAAPPPTKYMSENESDSNEFDF